MITSLSVKYARLPNWLLFSFWVICAMFAIYSDQFLVWRAGFITSWSCLLFYLLLGSFCKVISWEITGALDIKDL